MSQWVTPEGRMIAPPQFDAEHARRWLERDAAESYRHRPQYPAETFDVLLSLLPAGGPRTVLDIGCGTGNIARTLAPRVERVDAIDMSRAMVEAGRQLPGGEHANIRWQIATAEAAELDGPYGLIVGGSSLHWMDWHVVMPRFAAALAPGGMLAVATVENEPGPWSAGLSAIARRHSTFRDYVPFDMIGAWEAAGLFRKLGEHTTAAEEQERTIDEFIAGLHAMSNLARAHIDAEAFDAEVAAVLARHCPDGVVRAKARANLVWGEPLPGQA